MTSFFLDSKLPVIAKDPNYEVFFSRTNQNLELNFAKVVIKTDKVPIWLICLAEKNNTKRARRIPEALITKL